MLQAHFKHCALKPRLSLFALVLPLLFCGSSNAASPVAAAKPQFVAIALGTAGGLTEANLTSYLLAPFGSTDFVALDAGTVLTGLEQADRKKSFSDIVVPPESSLTVAGYILTERIKAYLLSHPHLDHIAGLVHNSPEALRMPFSVFPQRLIRCATTSLTVSFGRTFPMRAKVCSSRNIISSDFNREKNSLSLALN